MRMSLSMQVQSSLVNMTRATDGLTDAESRAATGKRILKPRTMFRGQIVPYLSDLL